MIRVTLVKRDENPANDIEYRGWFMEKDVKKTSKAGLPITMKYSFPKLELAF